MGAFILSPPTVANGIPISMCYSVPSLLPLPLLCPKQDYRTGPSAGLCPGDLSPLYLPSPFHLPRVCGWGDVKDAGKDNPPNILTVVESGSSVADRHDKHFIVCIPH